MKQKVALSATPKPHGYRPRCLHRGAPNIRIELRSKPRCIHSQAMTSIKSHPNTGSRMLEARREVRKRGTTDGRHRAEWYSQPPTTAVMTIARGTAVWALEHSSAMWNDLMFRKASAVGQDGRSEACMVCTHQSLPWSRSESFRFVIPHQPASDLNHAPIWSRESSAESQLRQTTPFHSSV